MPVQNNIFTTKTILTAWCKTGIHPLNSKVFTDIDFVPSHMTFICSHAPLSYPTTTVLEFFDIPLSDNLDYMNSLPSHLDNSDNDSSSSNSSDFSQAIDNSSKSCVATSKSIAEDEGIELEASGYANSSGVYVFDWQYCCILTRLQTLIMIQLHGKSSKTSSKIHTLCSPRPRNAFNSIFKTDTYMVIRGQHFTLYLQSAEMMQPQHLLLLKISSVTQWIPPQ